MVSGKVLSVHVAPAAEAPTVELPEVKAVAGLGLEGDRYFAKEGSFSHHGGEGREVTLVEIEAVEALEREFGVKIQAGETRRNVVTQGVPLNDLVGREFKLGDVTLRGIRLCEPCAHLERLVGQPILRGLVHRGGLRCDIVAGGVIRPGDPIEA